jgi:hypothetical protein
MMSDRTNLEALANGPTRRQAIVGVAMAFGALTLGSTKAWAGAAEEISHTAESIPKRLFSKRAGNASTKHSPTLNSSIRS